MTITSKYGCLSADNTFERNRRGKRERDILILIIFGLYWYLGCHVVEFAAIVIGTEMTNSRFYSNDY